MTGTYEKEGRSVNPKNRFLI